MAANRTFQEEAVNTAERKKQHTVWVCPKCGKTVHADRRYCDCHADLSCATARLTKNLPEIGPCNFETSGLNCNDCPEDCAWCASFGDPTTNKRGFGGKDCQHNAGTARCYCCQAQVKLGLEIGESSLSEIMGKITSETQITFADVAEFIQEKREKPILARIRRKREELEAPLELTGRAV
jgi:hypothetical protein